MATYYARKAGNINATDVWATTPGGVAAAVTFASGDVLMANSFAITVNVSTDLGGSGQVRNDTTGGATAGGNFTLSNGVTLTANVFSGNVGVQTIVFNAATGFLVGNITAGSPGGNWHSVNNSGSGTLTITGNVVAGGSASSHAVGNTSTGTITITGNVTGGSAATCIGARNNNTGTINITGTVTGGSNSTATGAENSSTGIINITGTAIGGTAAGASNTSTGSITATRAAGNGFGPGSVGLTAATGIANSGLGVVTIEQLEYGTLGQSPTTGTGFRLKKVGTNVAVFNYCDTAGAKTLIDATANAAMPASSDVRSGVSYASGALVGSCAVPAAGSVSLGVPVDNTTGTAILTQANVQSALTAQGLTTARAGNLDNLDATVSSRLSPSGTLATVTTLTNAPASVTASDIWSYATRTVTGGTVDTLTNAPSVPSASAIASQVRTELSVELGRVDAAISTRATPANIPTADIAAIKGKTDLLNTTRLAQVSTTEIVGNLLAQANS